MFLLFAFGLVHQSVAQCNITLHAEISNNCKDVSTRPCPPRCLASLDKNCPDPNAELSALWKSFEFCKPLPKCKLKLSQKECVGNCQWCNNKCQAGKAKCQSGCIDDSSGSLALFGFNCQSLLQAMRSNCSYDMSTFSPSLQGQTLGNFCPKSCSQCASRTNSSALRSAPPATPPAPPVTPPAPPVTPPPPAASPASSTNSDDPNCKDDPMGLVASQGLDCPIMLQIANNDCDFDLNSLTPQAPPGITPGQLCPKSCNRCDAKPLIPIANDSQPILCQDDPTGMVARFGFTCTSVLSVTGNDCNYDLSSLAGEIPKGVTPGQLCPKTCALCKDESGKTAPAPQKSTETFINGRVVGAAEKRWLEGLGVQFPPGRYFIKADGSAGPEGGPTMMNIYALAGQQISSKIDKAMEDSGFNRGIDRVQSTAIEIGDKTEAGFNTAVNWVTVAGQTSVNEITNAWNQLTSFFG